MTKLTPLRRLLLLAVILGLAAGFAVRPLAWDAVAGLVAAVVAVDLVRALRFGVDVIALLAIVGAVALGQRLTAIIIALMIAGGATLEEFAEARARRELAALIGRKARFDALIQISRGFGWWAAVGERLVATSATRGSCIAAAGLLVDVGEERSGHCLDTDVSGYYQRFPYFGQAYADL